MRLITVWFLLSVTSMVSAFIPTGIHQRLPTKQFMAEDDKVFGSSKEKRRGTSVDQDGKSNVWAVEPKMEVEVAKEGEIASKGGLIAGGAVAALILAAAIVSILPDVDAI